MESRENINSKDINKNIELKDSIIFGGKNKKIRTESLIGKSNNRVATNDMGHNLFSTIMLYIALFLGAYFFFIRPNKKRQKEAIDFVNGLKPGDDIILTSGLYGKIISIYDDEFLIEFGENKSLRVKVSKNHVFKKQNSDTQEDKNN
ncbi:MAG: preprotein translocase subunit YajC [Clostridiales bacterium]|jgi:preprotein translocase subunit YajC|nr:preprotein translocase subunit YajC [Clostridiales bacterium]